MKWSFVLGEEYTIRLLLDGFSIARFGDGEINLCFGGLCITQPHSARLSSQLKKLLKNPGKCLVGIPRQGSGPKREFWKKYDTDQVISLFKKDHHYASAFITRPDSAPWIDEPYYWKMVRNLWRGKDVTLVRGSEKSLTKELLSEARSVTEIVVQKKDAYSNYDSIMGKVINSSPRLVLLCLGPTATVMANDLCEKGLQALDLGHIGMFLKKHDQGLSMVVTEEEKRVDRV